MPFRSPQALEDRIEPFVPTRWLKRGSVPTPIVICEMLGNVASGDDAHRD